MLNRIKHSTEEYSKKLEIVEKHGYFHSFKQDIIQIIKDLKRGYSLSKSMAEKDIFSPLLVSMLKIGEDSGEMTLALKKSSDYFSSDYIYKLKHISTLAEPIMIIIMSIT